MLAFLFRGSGATVHEWALGVQETLDISLRDVQNFVLEYREQAISSEGIFGFFAVYDLSEEVVPLLRGNHTAVSGE